MLKSEFENLSGKEVTFDEFSVINEVYMGYPSIKDKSQIVAIYKAGGMQVIQDMKKRVDLILDINKKIEEKEKLSESLQEGIKTLSWQLEQIT